MTNYHNSEIESIGKGTVIADDLEIIRKGSRYLNLGIIIGEWSYISPGCCFMLGNLNKNPNSNLIIGNGVYINWGCFISGEGGVEIGDKTLIGPRVCILSAGHKYSRIGIPIQRQGFFYGKIVIEEDVWVGAGSIILKGVKLGKGCVVGAGAVVTEDVPSYAVVAGNPAKVIKVRGRSRAT